MGRGAPWLFRLRSLELREPSSGGASRGAADEARADDGLCIGRSDPGALSPDCVFIEVSGLNVTVLCFDRFGRDVDPRFWPLWVGSKGDDSSLADAMASVPLC